MLTSRRLVCSLVLAFMGALFSSSLVAQESVSPAVAFSEARALYYTPVDRGLQGFDCHVNFNWRQFIQRANNAPVPVDDQRLKYLESIKLTISDDLNGAGTLHWAAPTTSTATAPDGSEDSVAQMRSGMQAVVAGFFQSWNGFYTGDLLTLDRGASVERTPTGYHVFTRNRSGQVAEETYGGDFTMRSLHVSTKQYNSLLTPTFERTPQGRLVTELDSVVKQPPTAPGVDVKMTVHYAPVTGFQLPSEVLINVSGMANFDFHLSGCTVRMQGTPAPTTTRPAKP